MDLREFFPGAFCLVPLVLSCLAIIGSGGFLPIPSIQCSPIRISRKYSKSNQANSKETCKERIHLKVTAGCLWLCKNWSKDVIVSNRLATYSFALTGCLQGQTNSWESMTEPSHLLCHCSVNTVLQLQDVFICCEPFLGYLPSVVFFDTLSQ